MSLLTRISLILLLTFALLALGLGLSYRSATQSFAQLRVDRSDEQKRFLHSAAELQGVQLDSLVSSYSWWSDMVAFVADPQPEWASGNVDNIVGIPGGGDALWVTDPDLNLIHAIDSAYQRPALPFDQVEQLRNHIGNTYEFDYYTLIGGELWQIYGAAIQDPIFWRHETPVVGYLLLGKRWDDTWLARLGDLCQSRLRIDYATETPAAAPLPSNAALSRFTYPITGLTGDTLAIIAGSYDATFIEQSQQSLTRQALLFGLSAAIALTLLVVVIGLAVVRPLSQITRSLESRNPLHLTDLLGDKSDFGEIARLLSSQFRQGRMLQDEIRRRLAETRPGDENHERETNEALRLRLASDLHDGPLQSLYAAGLQISSLQSKLAAGKPPPVAQLESIRNILKDCSANLRNLLLDLEPEELRDQDLETALQRLERYMQSVSRRSAELTIEENLLDSLARDGQLQVYYIARELISNASRHAKPESTSLHFRRAAGFLLIEWDNDGFAPTESVKAGNGLRNISQRVQQLEGKWSYRIHRGKFWQVRIEIPFTALVGSVTIGAGTETLPD